MSIIIGYNTIGSNQVLRVNYTTTVNTTNPYTLTSSESGEVLSAWVYAARGADPVEIRAFIYKITGSDATSILVGSSVTAQIPFVFPTFGWVELPFSGSALLNASTSYGLAFSQRRISGATNAIFRMNTIAGSDRSYTDTDLDAPTDLTSFGSASTSRFTAYATLLIADTSTITSTAHILEIPPTP